MCRTSRHCRMPMPNTINTESSRTCGCRRLSRAFWTAWNSWNESKNKHIEHKTGQREARPRNRVFLCPAKHMRLSARCIQKRCCPCIDAHKLPLRLSVRLAHRHQKIHSLSDLLKVRRSEGVLMQMLQNTAISVLQGCGHGRLKEIG